MLEKYPEIRNVVGEIQNVFNGSDGGIHYIKLCSIIESLCDNASNGDIDAVKILEYIRAFHRLIIYAKENK